MFCAWRVVSSTALLDHDPGRISSTTNTGQDDTSPLELFINMYGCKRRGCVPSKIFNPIPYQIGSCRLYTLFYSFYFPLRTLQLDPNMLNKDKRYINIDLERQCTFQQLLDTKEGARDLTDWWLASDWSNQYILAREILGDPGLRRGLKSLGILDSKCNLQLLNGSGLNKLSKGLFYYQLGCAGMPITPRRREEDERTSSTTLMGGFPLM